MNEKRSEESDKLTKVPVLKWSSHYENGEEQYPHTYEYGNNFKINLNISKRKLTDRGFSRRYADKLQLSALSVSDKVFVKWQYEGQPTVYVAEDGFYIDGDVDLNTDKAELAKRLHHVYRAFSVLKSAGFVKILEGLKEK